MADGGQELEGATWRQAIVIGSGLLFAAAGGRDTTDGEEAIGDARYLLQHAIGAVSLDLIRTPERRLSHAEADAYGHVLRRRAAGEPVSRIKGTREFYGREFIITPATLDPRPDSETLIDAALKRVADAFPRGAGLEILDIGAGSGCLLLTLLAELPEARGVGVDPSAEALAVARDNARRLGVQERCSWVDGRCFAGLQRRFPLIISNPPYIAAAEIAGLATEVRCYDPALALDGGADGLDIYREIARDLSGHVCRGWVILEIGATQAVEVQTLVRAAMPGERLGAVDVVTDMAGKPRCVAIEIHA